jgi:hypothetical protein
MPRAILSTGMTRGRRLRPSIVGGALSMLAAIGLALASVPQVSAQTELLYSVDVDTGELVTISGGAPCADANGGAASARRGPRGED